MSKSVISGILGAIKKIWPEKSAEIDAISISDVQEVENNSTSNVEKNSSNGSRMKELDELLAQNVELKKNLAARDLELEQLKVAVGNYEKDKTDRETALEKQAEQKRKEEVEALLKKAIDEKKIPAKNEELQANFREILMKDLERGKTILDSITPIQGEKSETKQTGSNAPSGTVDLRKLAETAYASSSQN